ncbi:hypothetical protein HFO91_30315 [Rhizobium leguminosarum]|uniref:hypothetical protein n=1 Tax=Rhizobium leguminosarum TaxID=384 RepID=UPI001C9740F3|nr:hypothetical protein [Rhizobium leguminosarum]MBY5453874.1 hypothetical protein [Rhizobium leguminosarum]
MNIFDRIWRYLQPVALKPATEQVSAINESVERMPMFPLGVSAPKVDAEAAKIDRLREEWETATPGGKVFCVILFSVMAIAGVTAELLAFWHLFPAVTVTWSQAAIIGLAVAVICRAFIAYFPEHTKKVGYILSPVAIAVMLPATLAAVAVLLVLVIGVLIIAGIQWHIDFPITPKGRRRPLVPILLMIAVLGGIVAFVVIEHGPAAVTSTADQLWK